MILCDCGTRIHWSGALFPHKEFVTWKCSECELSLFSDELISIITTFDPKEWIKTTDFLEFYCKNLEIK